VFAGIFWLTSDFFKSLLQSATECAADEFASAQNRNLSAFGSAVAAVMGTAATGVPVVAV
jgi:hypothetical protein